MKNIHIKLRILGIAIIVFALLLHGGGLLKKKLLQNAAEKEEKTEYIDKDLKSKIDAAVDSGEAYEDNITDKRLEIPGEILEFVEEYPESISLIGNYANYHERTGGGEISEDEPSQNNIPILIQWDKRWGYDKYGGGYFCTTGCGPTCMSMVYTGLTGDKSLPPERMAGFCEEHDYYIKGQGTSWSLMDQGAALLGLQSRELAFREDELIAALKEGDPVIASVSEGDFTAKGHFIVLAGVDENDQIMINDPNSPTNCAKTWDPMRILRQSKQLWAFRRS